MKKNIGREIALLCLPVAIIGGVALLRSIGRDSLPSFLASNLFDPGPIRVEYSPLKSVGVKPFDVAQGYEWVGETTVQTRGNWNMPPGWTNVARDVAFPINTRLVYRCGKSWKQVPRQKGDHPFIDTSLNVDSQISTLRVDIDGVPANADEVRLRGAFGGSLYYLGVIPPGWKPPGNVRITGPNRCFTLKPNPFDVEIKGPNDPMPAPAASRASDLELIGVGWYYEPTIDWFVVRLRDRSSRGIFQHWGSLQLLSYSIRDGAGKEIALFDNYGKGAKEFVSGWSVISRDNFYPNLPSNEAIASFVPLSAAPRGGWSRVPLPITLNAQVSDGTSWPLRIRATLKPQNGNLKALALLPSAP